MTEAIVHSHRAALVVDSEPHVNAMLTRILTSGGWDIQRAVDNEAVLPLALQRNFDLIITSQKTSGSEDVQLLKKVKGIQPDVRMIILANENCPGDVIDAIRAGVFSYFTGPYTQPSLADIIRNGMETLTWHDGIEIHSATTSWVRLSARCDLTTASRLVEFLRAGTTIPEAEKDDVTAAFHEILLNAMEHGCNFDPCQYVDVSFIRSRRALVCRIKDPGPGFSQEEIRHAAFDTSPQELARHVAVREGMGLRPGGFGLLLAKRLCDEVLFNETGNDVLLIKYIDAAVPARLVTFENASAPEPS
jgi:DNA-binding NarL/FixJ family response regulator